MELSGDLLKNMSLMLAEVHANHSNNTKLIINILEFFGKMLQLEYKCDYLEEILETVQEH